MQPRTSAPVALLATVALALGLQLHATQSDVGRLEQRSRVQQRQIRDLVGIAEQQQGLIGKDVTLIQGVLANQEQLIGVLNGRARAPARMLAAR